MLQNARVHRIPYCVYGAGVGTNYFIKILLWVLYFVDLKLKCVSFCRESIIQLCYESKCELLHLQ